jgi:hypothetical protein
MTKRNRVSLARIQTACHKRGFNLRRVYEYDDSVVFFDLGNLWVYVPSDITVNPGKTYIQVLHTNPVPETEEMVENDAVFYDQCDRILSRCVGDSDMGVDASIVEGRYVYTAARRRKWKIRRAHKRGLRVAVDLPTFLRHSSFYRKSRITELHLHMIIGIPVPKTLQARKKEYESYIDNVLEIMIRVSDAVRSYVEKIKKVREEGREHLKFVSIDIDTANEVARCERKIRRCNTDQLHAKNLLKEAVGNMAAFVLSADSAAHVLSLTSGDVARASETLSRLR